MKHWHAEKFTEKGSELLEGKKTHTSLFLNFLYL